MHLEAALKFGPAFIYNAKNSVQLGQLGSSHMSAELGTLDEKCPTSYSYHFEVPGRTGQDCLSLHGSVRFHVVTGLRLRIVQLVVAGEQRALMAGHQAGSHQENQRSSQLHRREGGMSSLCWLCRIIIIVGASHGRNAWDMSASRRARPNPAPCCAAYDVNAPLVVYGNPWNLKVDPHCHHSFVYW